MPLLCYNLLNIELSRKKGTIMNDKAILYDLACKVKELALSEQMRKKRDLWRNHNSFKGQQPLIYIRAFAFHEFFDSSVLKCEHPLLRRIETEFHQTIFRSTIGDDYIIEPWVEIPAVYEMENGERWSAHVELGEKMHVGAAAAFKPCIHDEDFSFIKSSPYKVNEEKTTLKKELVEEALGGALPVFVSRQGPFVMWGGDLSTDLAKMRGLEQIMWDAYDRPEWLHSLVAHMRDCVLKSHEEAEKAGGYSLADHQNQAMPYALELDDPNPAVQGVKRKQLWRFLAAQEFTTFGPEMFWEFMIEYQKPIMEQFGMSAYGCCEDLTRVIPYLKRINNLRRIAVSPFADAKKCAEQIGTDYILSWRPSPSLMLATGLDEDCVRKHMREHFEVFKSNNSIFDITLKDVETINRQPQNVQRWTEIVREEIVKAF